MIHYKALTLDGLITALQSYEEALMEKLHSPASYRGYYDGLAFEVMPEPVPASENLRVVRDCIDYTFNGYKGGEHTMKLHTPVWIHRQWGSTAGAGRICGIQGALGKPYQFVICGDYW